MDLDELERLHREATPGEWRHGSVEKGAVFVFYAEALGGYERVLFRANGAFDYSADLALACAAVNALPELLQAARRAATMTSADGVISSLKATLESLRRERDAAFDRGRTAGRLDVEWAATVAAGGTDVRAAARRYLMGEKPPRLAALESLAEDARTCAEWCKHMDVGSGAETGAAARRVLAGIGGVK